MKQKRLPGMLTVFAMLLTLLPVMPAEAYVDSSVCFKRVTSADDLVVGAKYLIVGYDADAEAYYALGDQIFNEPQNSGLRSSAMLKDNGDSTLSALEQYDISVYPLVVELSKQYVTSDNKYSLKTVDYTGGYLNAFYSTASKTYEFSHNYSKSLPIDGSNGASNWDPIIRDDGTVLFKTTKKINSVEQSAYIRFYHYIVKGFFSDSIATAFSGGLISDSNIDLDGTGLTTGDLTEDNIPVNTYLYKEVCAHDEGGLTHYDEKASTCSARGNIEYYYCSNCCGYLLPDKITEIKLSDTVLPFAAHANTTFVPAAEPTCIAHGNIDYTYCADCGGYFEGNSTETPIDINDTVIIAVNHSYVDGVCSFCGKTAENAYFGRNGKTGDGSVYIFAAEYDGKFYAMGVQTEKGMKAVEVQETAEGKLAANSETVPFAEEIESDGSIYIKIGESYLKNNSLMLTLVPHMDTATCWSSKWGYDASYNYVNYLSDSGARICLVTGDGEPYFSMCETTDSTHISAYRYGELCSHQGGIEHVPAIEPTCIRDGKREYWYCTKCNCYFSDEACLNVIYESDIPILADGAKDSNNDGICDLCGKTMPVYTKVTSADEIVIGGQYILVSEILGDHYALKMPEKVKGGDFYDLGIEMAAEHITPENDGTIKFNSARSKGAIMMKLDFACECSDLDQGTVRYGLCTTVGNRVLKLESYEGFCLTDYAKYGWRIGLNEDGSVKMSDVYEESLEDWNAGSGKLCVYKHWDKAYNASVFFSSSDKEAHTTENTDSITKWPVYLYKLTETGTVNNIKYTLFDKKSAVTSGVELPSEAAAKMSNVSGVSQALKQKSIEDFVTKAAADDNLRMSVDVSITASSYTAADKETGAGASISYTISPKVNIATDSNPAGTEYDIPDTAFDGSPMTVMLYTGGTDPQQIVHIKQDGTKEYFYPEWSEQVMLNGENAFTQIWDSNGNMYVTFKITEFSEIRLLETPEIPEKGVFYIADYDEKAGAVTVSCAEAGEYYLVFADYENKTLKNVQYVKSNFNSGLNTIETKLDFSLSLGDKIFFWESMANLCPLCDEYEILK